MKRFKTASITLVLASALLLSSCYGPFKLTTGLHEWNGSLGDKWINSLVFFGLCVVPVYEVAATVDYLVLNTVEFWTGENPMGSANFKKMEKLVENENGSYKITAKRNSIVIEGLSGVDQGKKVKMKIDEDTKELFLEKEGELIKLAEFDELAQVVRVYSPNGQVSEFSAELTDPVAYVQEIQNQTK